MTWVAQRHGEVASASHDIIRAAWSFALPAAEGLREFGVFFEYLNLSPYHTQVSLFGFADITLSVCMFFEHGDSASWRSIIEAEVRPGGQIFEDG